MYLTIFAGVLIGLAATVNPALADAESFSPAMVVLWTVLLVASAPLPGVLASMLAHPETMGDPESRARTLRVVRVGSLVAQAWLLGAFALVTYVVRWPLFVEGTLALHGWVLVDELLRLAPFFAMLFLAWVPAWRIDRALRMGAWSLREYVEFQVRQNLLLVLLPIAALVTLDDLLRTVSGGREVEATGLGLLLMFALLGTIFLYSGEALRRIWKTRRLEDGPLRDRLEALSARAGIVSRDTLVWETLGGHIPNACVVGAVPTMRYVMVTDALMDALPPEEIEAVFAHELGHVKRRHVTWYGAFAVSLFALLTALSELPAFRALSAHPDGSGLLTLQGFLGTAGAALYWAFAFSFVSRRMEIEADLYAVSLTNTADFVGALERIAFLSGRARSAGSWRHFSIAKRVSFLLACEADGAVRERFERRMRVLRAALVVLAALSALAAGWALL